MSTDKNKEVVKSGLWYTVASVAIRAVAIVTSPIYTALLGSDNYGIANIFNTWVDIFNIFTCLCVVYSIGRAKLDFPDKFDEYMSALQGLSSSFAFVVLIVVTIFREQVAAWIQYEVPLVIVLFTYLCISPSVEYTLQKCRYEYKYKQNIMISVITCLGTVALSIILIFVFNDRRYIGKILGTILPTFMMGIVFYINILKKGKVFYNKEYWIYALKFGLPMIPHAFALVILAQIDRVMIKSMCGEGYAGLYSFGYMFATLLFIFTNAIGQTWLPWFNEELFAGRKDGIREAQKKLVLLGIFLSLAFVTVAPEALMILSFKAPEFWVAKWVVPPVALGTLAQYFYTNYVNLELYHKKTKLIAASSIFAAIVNYFLNSLCIPSFGYVAAAYTTLASYFILMIFHYVATKHVMKEKVYQDSFMFIGFAVAIALTAVEMVFYRDGMANIVLRYASALIIIGIFAFIRRNDIMILRSQFNLRALLTRLRR